MNRNVVYCISSNPSPDFYVLINNTIFALHKNIIQNCGYFKKKDIQAGKVYIINDDIDIKSFIFTLEWIYGKKQRFPNSKDIFKILDVAQFLQYPSLSKQLCAEFQTNFEEYGFFIILKIAERLKSKSLLYKCCKDIIGCNFQQININKIDLFEYSETSFISIIRKHNLIKSQKIIVGLLDKNIENIIKQYEQIHGVTINMDKLNTQSISDLDFQQAINDIRKSQSKTFKLLRKRSKTWDVTSPYQTCPSQKQQTQSSCSSNIKQQIQALTLLNQKMCEQNKNMINDISQVKSSFSKDSQRISASTLDQIEIDYKIQKIQKQWKKQDEKYLGIIKRIKTFQENQQQKILKTYSINIDSSFVFEKKNGTV